MPIIQALCRASLTSGSPAVRKQVERLRDAAQAVGDTATVQVLDKLLTQSTRTSEMAPSQLVQSRLATITGEELTPNTPVPVDRETSARLAEVCFADALPQTIPIFAADLEKAARTLLQEWQSAERLRAVGVEPATTCLIYGPPGTGKTTLALWLARQLGVPAVIARLDGLISSFLGTTARNVSNLFAFANRYRCVLVLDEFDAVAKIRDDPHEVGEIKRVVNALLQNIDSRKGVGITVAVTNHEGLLDPAIWRRFEIQLQVPRPSVEGRLAILRSILPPVTMPAAAERFIAWLTEGLSGAEVETFVRNFKKQVAVNGETADDLISIVRGLAVLNGSRMAADKLQFLTLHPQQFARDVLKVTELNLNLTEVGALLNRDKATIGRWVGTVTRRSNGKRADSGNPSR